MTIFDGKHRGIIIECLKNKGLGFDYEDITSKKEYHWEEQYWTKKGIFRYYWELLATHIPDYMTEYENSLKSLPSGISYERQTTKWKDEREEKTPEKCGNARCCYRTRFRIHVSEQFSRHVMEQYDGSRLVVWDCPELKSALDFKNRVLSTHREILETLFTNGVLKSYSLTKSGFTDYDCSGYNLKQVGMKPLQDDTQCLGLMIAICECYLSQIPDDEIWFIEKTNHYDGSFDIHVSKIGIPNTAAEESLSEW